jgi:predicted PurR-regulated permease PerM
MTLTVFAGLNLIQFVVGSYLEPRIAGRVLSISPFVVLLAVLFWTFLWGIAGAFIGVPIVIAVLTICRQYPSSQWLAELLGGEGRHAPAAS